MQSVLNTLSENTYFYLFWKLMKAFTVFLRTNIVLHHIKQHFILIIIYQSQCIKSIYFQIYFIYTIKWGWLGPMFGIFHDLLMIIITATTQPLSPRIYNTVPSLSWIENTSSLIIRLFFLACKHELLFEKCGNLVLHILDLKLISFFFFLYSDIIADI